MAKIDPITGRASWLPGDKGEKQDLNDVLEWAMRNRLLGFLKREF